MSIAIPHTFVDGALIQASQFNDNFAAVKAAVDVLGNLYITSPQTVATDTTRSGRIRVDNGALITISNGATLYINGPFTAGLYQVFNCEGTGKVVFGGSSVIEVYPEWWGGNIKQAFDSFHSVKLGAGTYTITDPIYLNSGVFDITYSLKGIGRASKINISGFGAGAKVFFLNDDGAGNRGLGAAYPSHPRFIMDGIFVDGTNSPLGAHLLYFNTASWQFRNVYLKKLLYGAKGTGYTDSITLENVYWESAISGGWCYEQTSNGDSVKIDRLFCTGYHGIKLHRCAGATIQSINGGVHQIMDSHAIKIIASHFEQFDYTSYPQVNTESQLVIGGSQVSIEDCLLWNSRPTNNTVPAITIDDSLALSMTRHGTQLTLSNVKFLSAQRLSSGLPLADVYRNSDVYIKSLYANASIRIRNCTGSFSELINSGGSWSTLWNFAVFGIVVTSNITQLQTELSKMAGFVANDVEIKSTKDSWKVLPCSSNIFSIEKTTAPYFGASLNLQTTRYGSLVNGTTYYYTASFLTATGESAKMTEISKTTTGDNQTISWNMANAVIGCVLRIWRGTSTGTYDCYVDIPMKESYVVGMMDFGNHVDGFSWITSGIPTPSSTTSIFDETITIGQSGSGTPSFQRTAYNFTAAPTVGTWGIGDRAVRVPVVGQPGSWVCTVAGTPGTWVSEGTL